MDMLPLFGKKSWDLLHVVKKKSYFPGNILDYVLKFGKSTKINITNAILAQL